MKNIILLFSVLWLCSCTPKKTALQKPSFLLGNWIRTNTTDSVKTYENWRNDFSGTGITLKGKDTTFFEKMKIEEKKDSLFLVVSGVNETNTWFKFTSQTDTSFICKNSQNEFPKKIQYYLENNQLKAIVSSENYKIDFVFKKVN